MEIKWKRKWCQKREKERLNRETKQMERRESWIRKRR
jgi:hypothetical protein